MHDADGDSDGSRDEVSWDFKRIKTVRKKSRFSDDHHQVIIKRSTGESCNNCSSFLLNSSQAV